MGWAIHEKFPFMAGPEHMYFIPGITHHYIVDGNSTAITYPPPQPRPTVDVKNA